MLTYDAAYEFYRVILMSFLGEDITWIDENDVESTIRAVVDRFGVGSTAPRLTNTITSSKQRQLSIQIANSATYGRVDIKCNVETVRFKLNKTDTNEHTFQVGKILESDQAKVGLICRL